MFLLPTDNIYKNWKVDESVSNTDIAQMETSDGQLRIKQNGIYLVYGQVVFYSSARYCLNFKTSV